MEILLTIKSASMPIAVKTTAVMRIIPKVTSIGFPRSIQLPINTKNASATRIRLKGMKNAKGLKYNVVRMIS